MELYFEVDDFDEFIEKLNYYKDVEFVHKFVKIINLKIKYNYI